MARRSVIGLLATALAAAGCVSISPASLLSQAPDTSTPRVLIHPTFPPELTLPPLPTPPPLPTLPPTEPPTPTTSSEPPPTTTLQTTLPTENATGSGAPAITPPASPIDISALLTAPVGLVNLSDNPVTVSLDIFDSGSDQGTIAKRDISPYGSIFENVLEATYLATFTQTGVSDQTCTFDAKTGIEVDFTIIGTNVLITKTGVDPASGADLFVATSPLCKPNGP